MQSLFRSERLLLMVVVLALAPGCVIGHQQFVRYEAPVKFPPADDTWVFEYSNVDIRQLKDVLFPEYLTLAESSFNGPYEDPAMSQRFAASIGADVFIVATQFSETRTTLMPLTTPSSSTTTFSGSVGTRPFSGSATTFGTTTAMIPITVHRYDQEGLFLRNMTNGFVPLWLRKREHYPATAQSAFDGRWRDDQYELEVLRSNDQIVGVVSRPTAEATRSGWNHNDVKFVFGLESRKGVYLMGNRTPMPASVSINPFGFLEFELIPGGRRISFVRM